MQRGGKKGQPHFRIVLQEHSDAVKGKAKEILGYYKPAIDPKVFKVDTERVKYWLTHGVRVSDSLAVLLKNEGLEGMDQFIEPRNKKKKKKGEGGAPAATEAAPAPKAEADAPAEPAPESPAEEVPVETPKEEPVKEESPAEAPKEEPKEESPAEEPAPEEEKPTEN